MSRKLARFAPTDIAADVSGLPPHERQALTHMIQAAQVMDALFLEQVWAGNEAMLLDLMRDDSEAGKTRLHYFLLNKGPWSRLDHNEPFIPGATAQTRLSQLLSCGCRQGRGREVDPVVASGREGSGDRLLHVNPPRP